MSTADSYRKKAEECVAGAKAAMGNEERARNYKLAEQYMRLAERAQQVHSAIVRALRLGSLV